MRRPLIIDRRPLVSLSLSLSLRCSCDSQLSRASRPEGRPEPIQPMPRRLPLPNPQLPTVYQSSPSSSAGCMLRSEPFTGHGVGRASRSPSRCVRGVGMGGNFFAMGSPSREPCHPGIRPAPGYGPAPRHLRSQGRWLCAVCGPACRRFASGYPWYKTLFSAPVAQLDRVPGYEPGVVGSNPAGRATNGAASKRHDIAHQAALGILLLGQSRRFTSDTRSA